MFKGPQCRKVSGSWRVGVFQREKGRRDNTVDRDGDIADDEYY